MLQTARCRPSACRPQRPVTAAQLRAHPEPCHPLLPRASRPSMLHTPTGAPAGATHGLAAGQAVGGIHGNAAHGVVTHVLRNLRHGKRARAGTVGGPRAAHHQQGCHGKHPGRSPLSGAAAAAADVASARSRAGTRRALMGGNQPTDCLTSSTRRIS